MVKGETPPPGIVTPEMMKEEDHLIDSGVFTGMTVGQARALLKKAEKEGVKVETLIKHADPKAKK